MDYENLRQEYEQIENMDSQREDLRSGSEMDTPTPADRDATMHNVARADILRTGTTGSVNVHDIVERVVQALAERQYMPVGKTRPTFGELENATSENGYGANWNQIKFASKLIPLFLGKDGENMIK